MLITAFDESGESVQDVSSLSMQLDISKFDIHTDASPGLCATAPKSGACQANWISKDDCGLTYHPLGGSVDGEFEVMVIGRCSGIEVETNPACSGEIGDPSCVWPNQRIRKQQRQQQQHFGSAVPLC